MKSFPNIKMDYECYSYYPFVRLDYLYLDLCLRAATVTISSTSSELSFSLESKWERTSLALRKVSCAMERTISSSEFCNFCPWPLWVQWLNNNNTACSFLHFTYLFRDRHQVGSLCRLNRINLHTLRGRDEACRVFITTTESRTENHENSRGESS